ncbi:Canalicular multispecific organic anion transporter 1 [Chytriomyces hyalinus]|nr:Canalicular multispecific organic anion transporter 1 [Chytriomyces hyalinus]
MVKALLITSVCVAGWMVLHEYFSERNTGAYILAGGWTLLMAVTVARTAFQRRESGPLPDSLSLPQSETTPLLQQDRIDSDQLTAAAAIATNSTAASISLRRLVLLSLASALLSGVLAHMLSNAALAGASATALTCAVLIYLLSGSYLSSLLLALSLSFAQFLLLIVSVYLPQLNDINPAVAVLIMLSFLINTHAILLICSPASHKLPTSATISSNNCLDTASFFSIYTFHWIKPTLVAANANGKLLASHLPALSAADCPAHLHSKFGRALSLSAAGPLSPLQLLILCAFRIQPTVFLSSFLHGIVFLLCMFIDPILLNRLLSPESLFSLPSSFALISALAISMLVRVSCMEVCYFDSTRVANNVRTALVQAIFTSTINNPAAVASNSGMLANLMATDADKLGQFSWGIFFLAQWTFAVASLPFVLYFMHKLVGNGAFLAVGVLLGSTLFSRFVGSILSAAQRRLQECKDDRSKIMQHLIRSIKVTKLEGLESMWRDKLFQARARELKQLRSVQFMGAFNNLCGALFALSVPLSMFMWVTLVDGKPLDAATAFSAFAWIAQMQWSISSIPYIFNMWASLQPSLERVANWIKLTAGSQEHSTLETVQCCETSHRTGEIHFCDAPINQADDAVKRDQVDLNILPGKLFVVIGTTGSGKSHLLSNLTAPPRPNDSTSPSFSGCSHPNICAHGTIALVQQTPFLLNATIRENILFGHPFIASKMQEALLATDLVPDLAALPAGLETRVGPNGVQLSGGQKARVCLARAFYAAHDVDIFCLDDVLSAVDRTTAIRLWDRVVCRLKAMGKTIVLVTHQVQFLAREGVDGVVVMEAGNVAAVAMVEPGFNVADRLDRLLKENSHVARCLELLNQESAEAEKNADNDDVPVEQAKKGSVPPVWIGAGAGKHGLNQSEGQAVQNEEEIVERTLSLAEVRGFLGPLLQSLNGKSLTANMIRDQILVHFRNPADDASALLSSSSAEVSQAGSVSWSDFQYYLNHFGSFFGSIGVLIVIAFLWICTSVGASVWISIWTNANETSGGDGKPDNQFSQVAYLAVYGAFGCFEALIVCCQAVVLCLAAVRASTSVHQEMVVKLLTAPLSYFDSHSSGFILNRFLQDLGSIDSSVPQTLQDFITKTFSISAQFLLIVLITPMVLLIAPFVIMFYVFVATTFRLAARDTRRIESAARSPVYDLFNDVLNGLDTIRCYRAQPRFEKWNATLVSKMAQAKVSNEAVNKWAQALIVQSSCVFYFCSGFIGVYLVHGNFISVSSFGLVLMYAASLQRALMDYVMGLTNLETNFVAVERVAEFVRMPGSLGPVADAEGGGEGNSYFSEPASRLVAKGPGKLEVRQLRVRYSINRGEVLKGVTFTVGPGLKVAIIGRTGCGKSSLMATLAQLYPASSGTIRMDGVAINSMAASQVRQIMRIIPQETVLFDGSIRENLVLGKTFLATSDSVDAAIWRVLETVRLKDRVGRLPGGLDFELEFSGGKEFSAGERQLLCLARAMMSSYISSSGEEGGADECLPNLLLCDEVTANVDLVTDFLVLQALLSLKSSVMMVMHRLEHLRKFDRILMLDAGRVVAYGDANELIDGNEHVQRFMMQQPHSECF